MNRRNWGSLAVILVALPAFAQQTGAIVGKVTAKDGKGIAGVQIDAASSVMPQPRRVVTGENGEYRLPFLPPGMYTLTFLKSGLLPAKRAVEVLLQQNTGVNVAMNVAEIASAQVEVTAQATLVDRSSAELKSAVSSDMINAVPSGHDYRDMMKLIPGVAYTQDTVRGPSAGGSGQDNVYKFDGVNVTMPLFGTLSAEPATHDIDQIAVVKGGADATGFNRAAGFSVNSVSKSGTNTFTGGLSYDLRRDSWVAKRTNASASQFEQNRTYLAFDVGGPVLADKLFFFASYYRPTYTQQNQSNVYGAVPELESVRNEGFGKLTIAPFNTLLISASFRSSKKSESHYGIGGFSNPSVSMGYESEQKISILEGTWNVVPNGFFNFKYTDFGLKTKGRPDTLMPFKAAVDGSMKLNVSALDTQGLFNVPSPKTGTTAPELAYNATIAPFIAKYGYISATTGLATGGGAVGGGSQIDANDFYRRSWQIAYDTTIGSEVTHDLHFAYQWNLDSEDLARTANGWGSIQMPYNTTVPTGFPNAGQAVTYQATLSQQGILRPTIHSEYSSENIEVNDKIRWRDFTFNVGFMISDDRLYGQDLKENPYTISGYEVSLGSKYLMHEIKWKDTLQPRFGVTWAYSGSNTVYANWARYVPSASSLPRAASWARNWVSRIIDVYFDASGNMLANVPRSSSAGKLFQAGIKPRRTDELLLGTTRDFGKGLTARLYGRYRRSYNFWEDTNNNARLDFAAPDSVPHAYYIENLGAKMAQLGGGSNNSYVIAQLDGSLNRYYEVALETEYSREKFTLGGSYVWSHYFGNFDQDASTGGATANDSNVFIGSSNIADDQGRQLWNFKYGNLRGDRRHKLKVYGYYTTPWQGQIGFYAIYQSGQPWEKHDYKLYTGIGGSADDTNRYAEPAGSQVSSSHTQLDLKYMQPFSLFQKVRLELILDVFNVFNKQTGYNIQYNANTTTTYGRPLSFYNPRTMQLGLKLKF